MAPVSIILLDNIEFDYNYWLFLPFNQLLNFVAGWGGATYKNYNNASQPSIPYIWVYLNIWIFFKVSINFSCNLFLLTISLRNIENNTVKVVNVKYSQVNAVSFLY